MSLVRENRFSHLAFRLAIVKKLLCGRCHVLYQCVIMFQFEDKKEEDSTRSRRWTITSPTNTPLVSYSLCDECLLLLLDLFPSSRVVGIILDFSIPVLPVTSSASILNNHILHCFYQMFSNHTYGFQGSTLAVFRYPEHPRFSDGIPDSLAQ